MTTAAIASANAPDAPRATALRPPKSSSMSDQDSSAHVPENFALAPRGTRKRAPVGTRISRGNRIADPSLKRTIRIVFRVSPAEIESVLGTGNSIDPNQYARDRFLKKRNRRTPIRRRLDALGVASREFEAQLETALFILERGHDAGAVAQLRFAHGRLRNIATELARDPRRRIIGRISYGRSRQDIALYLDTEKENPEISRAVRTFGINLNSDDPFDATALMGEFSDEHQTATKRVVHLSISFSPRDAERSIPSGCATSQSPSWTTSTSTDSTRFASSTATNSTRTST
jgi:hypothetical protein